MRILLVEDERKLAVAVGRALELQKYAVDIEHDGDQGLDLALGEEYDLMILDIMLPGIDGLQICQQVRENKINTPVLLLTAKGQISDKVKGLDIGADDYLVKPFSFEELFARVRALIRRQSKHKNNILKSGKVTLDSNTFKVNAAGKEVQLSSKEFSILEYLLRNRNIVITKDNLISHIWNYEAEVMPNVVEVHVKHLRDKIAIPNEPSIIRTIRGRGYTIQE